MESHLTQEIELTKKYDDILKKRAALLKEMESQQEQHKNKKKQQTKVSEAARKRNAKLLKDLQEIENRLITRPLPHPDIVSLETQYWAYVEEKIPEWESFLLGRGPSPLRDRERSPGKRRQKSTFRHNY
ncbi:uncharacterized protein C3orf14 homolog [Megalops cyprinoides]|uniref:uncharacterized protein C3orf14 homolog n=1 Tax=Megalops cyprinoides TaxID=118141 RepID=UPI0018654AE9|nr:uncharacterized protein C3orf14 homolog [Megalops cyprinoides]